MVTLDSKPTRFPRPAHLPAAPVTTAPPPKGDAPPAKGGAAAFAPSARALALVGDAVVSSTARRSDVAPVLASTTTTAQGGARKLKTREAFEAFAKRDDVPGAAGVLAVKFLVEGVDTKSPKVWLVDANQHAYHWDFATNGLGKPISLRDFNAQTYFTDSRKFIAGTVVAHDSYARESGEKGLYAVEFWPTDPVKARHVNKAFDLLTKALPFAKGQLAYHPAGDTQEALARDEASSLKRMKVPVISTEELFKGVTFSALNKGVGFGTLRVVDGADSGPPLTARDVVLFKGALPNDITHVGGILTETPQTPLSHINLKAQQNDTPNAYLKDASSDPHIASLVGKVVRYEVGESGLEMREATRDEAEAWLESVRPATPQTAPRDLSRTEILPFSSLRAGDAGAYGAKTANIAELRTFLPGDMVPDGFGIPFSFYDELMRHNGLYDEATRMMSEPGFKDDAAVREKALKKLRKKIENAVVPPALAAKLAELHAQFPPGQPIRCRSSTNNEDLEGFNGAGLYESKTHRPDEGALENTVKEVWAGLWTFRAFEEREFWRIDHLQAAMGVTVHPNQDDELANGVAITKNIYDENWPGFYVNAQVGESLVTNPTPGAVPEEMLISAIGPRGEYEIQRLRRSSENDGKAVLDDAQVQALVVEMEKIRRHFARVYGREGDPKFAMDIEFKITAAGKLQIKQARPVVD